MSNEVKVAVYLVVIAVAVVVGAWLGTVVWHWIVPDVFAGAVDQGILPAYITGWQSFKLSIFFWIWGFRSQASNKG